MEMKIQKLTLENFRIHRRYVLEFGNVRTAITAENRRGKTSIKDSYLWLLFDKSSDGRTKYEYRPLDDNNEPVRGLVVAVEAEVTFDGIQHTLRKEEHEKVSKSGDYSYPAIYLIDEVPKSKTEFREFVASWVGEDIFRQVTDLDYFHETMHHKARRLMLLEMAGNIGIPDGYEDTVKWLDGRTVDEMRTVLAKRKKAHEDARDEIGPEIRGHQAYAQYEAAEGEEAITAQRDRIDKTLAGIAVERKEIVADEQQRQVAMNELAKLKEELALRAVAVRADTSGVEDLQSEAQGLRTSLDNLRTELAGINGKVRTIAIERDSVAEEVAVLMTNRERSRKNLDALKSGPTAKQCPAGDDCPYADQTKADTSLQESALADVKAALTKTCDKIKANQTESGQLTKKIAALREIRIKAEADLLDAATTADKRLTEIAEEIQACPGKKPEEDEEWNDLYTKIKKATLAIGSPVADVLEELEARKSGAEALREKYVDALANADTAKRAKVSIAELEAKERDLSQKVADVDKRADELSRYEAAQSNLITTAVNGRFEHVTWKLFRERLNGNLEPCCMALLDGTPYPECSTGEKALCRVDTINVLGTYHAVRLPLFMDNFESITLPIDVLSQVILFKAKEGVTELKVEVA